MAKVTRFVGLDYHQDSIQVCVQDESGRTLRNLKVGNDVAQVRWVVRDTFENPVDKNSLEKKKSLEQSQIPQQIPQQPGLIRAAIESCVGAAHLAEELMRDELWSVTLAHPGIVARMKQNPDKSDHTDSFILADLMRLGYLPKVWLAPEEIRQLRALVRYRTQLVKQGTRVKLRVRSILREQRLKCSEGMAAWTKRWLTWLNSLNLDDISSFLRNEHLEELLRLEQKIAAAQKRMVQLCADDAVVQKLLQIEGIGLVTAITMRAEVARFDRFSSGKQLARYCGVTPRNASSGQKQADAGLVKAGNPGLRIVLVQAAQRLMRTSPRWSVFAARLKRKGKAHNVIVAAVANRWLRCLYHELKPGQLVQASAT
jgi:transposase